MIMINEEMERSNHGLTETQDNRKNIRQVSPDTTTESDLPSLEQECTNLYCQLCRPEL